jgi:hypothetical protein
MYWSSTAVTNNSSKALLCSFQFSSDGYDGTVHFESDSKNNGWRVHCVREEP